MFATLLNLVSRLKMSGDTLPLPLYAVMTWTITLLLLTSFYMCLYSHIQQDALNSKHCAFYSRRNQFESYYVHFGYTAYFMAFLSLYKQSRTRMFFCIFLYSLLIILLFIAIWAMWEIVNTFYVANTMHTLTCHRPTNFVNKPQNTNHNK
jgi:hypothetical protein